MEGPYNIYHVISHGGDLVMRCQTFYIDHNFRHIWRDLRDSPRYITIGDSVLYDYQDHFTLIRDSPQQYDLFFINKTIYTAGKYRLEANLGLFFDREKSAKLLMIGEYIYII